MHEQEPMVWPAHYADDLRHKEALPAEMFLVLDPLVSLSTAIASRSWVWSLAWAGVILAVCLLIPRGFCGYLCPLGTLIDLFDWAIGKRVTRFRVAEDGWWVHIKYYLLLGCLICAVGGVLVTGYVAAIPVITRGLLFLGDPLQSGMLRGCI
jgi:polyferredoxin